MRTDPHHEPDQTAEAKRRLTLMAIAAIVFVLLMFAARAVFE